jgi:biopolymer transport protein ExbB
MSVLINQVIETAGRLALVAAAASVKAAPSEAAPSEAAPSEAVPAAARAPASAPPAAAPAVAGQVASSAKEKQWYESGALGYMILGGVFMWPILLLGILAAGVIIERWRSLKMLGTDTETLRGQVLKLLNQDRVEEAVSLCDSEQGPVPAILSTGLRKFLVLKRLNYDPGKIEEQVVKTMDDYGVHIVAALERHLPILATVASAAPMLGFLGTVQGMVISFDDIEMVSKVGGQNIIEAAAAGIKVALLTTVLGLVVGIPAFIAYNYFNSVINRFVLDVEETASDLIEAVTLQMALGDRSNAAVSGSAENGSEAPLERRTAPA